METNNKEMWNECWSRHLENYLKTPPRTGIFIENYFKGKANSILEVAGGSCRDSRYLANKGFHVVCSDFNENLIAYLRKEFSSKNLKYKVADAFDLPFSNNSFDLVFHNGFFIYFSDNEKLYKLLKEEERISRKYIVIFVHNRKNTKLVEVFNKKKQNDNLYNIRFFEKHELVNIIKNSGINYKSITILKFGGIFDILYRKKIKGMPNIFYPIAHKIVPKLYQYQPWSKVERICCIIELMK